MNDISKDDTNTIISCIKSFSSGLLIGHGTNEIVRGMSANEVKRSLRVNLASFKKEVEKLSKKYKKAFEKAQKKDATLIKESVEEIKLNIYESCHAGEITEAERDILLGIVE